MITQYETKTPNGCLEVSFSDELRKKIIKAAIILLDDDDFDGMDKMIKSALVRGVVREVMMEQYPEALDLLPKDENKQADAIYLMGQDVECGLSTKGFVITKNISVAANSNTPEETLKVLATDTNSLVRLNVSQNPNTPPETSWTARHLHLVKRSERQSVKLRRD